MRHFLLGRLSIHRFPRSVLPGTNEHGQHRLGRRDRPALVPGDVRPDHGHELDSRRAQFQHSPVYETAWTIPDKIFHPTVGPGGQTDRVPVLRKEAGIQQKLENPAILLPLAQPFDLLAERILRWLPVAKPSRPLPGLDSFRHKRAQGIRIAIVASESKLRPQDHGKDAVLQRERGFQGVAPTGGPQGSQVGTTHRVALGRTELPRIEVKREHLPGRVHFGSRCPCLAHLQFAVARRPGEPECVDHPGSSIEVHHHHVRSSVPVRIRYDGANRCGIQPLHFHRRSEVSNDRSLRITRIAPGRKSDGIRRTDDGVDRPVVDGKQQGLAAGIPGRIAGNHPGGSRERSAHEVRAAAQTGGVQCFRSPYGQGILGRPAQDPRTDRNRRNALHGRKRDPGRRRVPLEPRRDRTLGPSGGPGRLRAIERPLHRKRVRGNLPGSPRKIQHRAGIRPTQDQSVVRIPGEGELHHHGVQTTVAVAIQEYRRIRRQNPPGDRPDHRVQADRIHRHLQAGHEGNVGTDLEGGVSIDQANVPGRAPAGIRHEHLRSGRIDAQLPVPPDGTAGSPYLHGHMHRTPRHGVGRERVHDRPVPADEPQTERTESDRRHDRRRPQEPPGKGNLRSGHGSVRSDAKKRAPVLDDNGIRPVVRGIGQDHSGIGSPHAELARAGSTMPGATPDLDAQQGIGHHVAIHPSAVDQDPGSVPIAKTIGPEMDRSDHSARP